LEKQDEGNDFLDQELHCLHVKCLDKSKSFPLLLFSFSFVFPFLLSDPLKIFRDCKYIFQGIYDFFATFRYDQDRNIYLVWGQPRRPSRGVFLIFKNPIHFENHAHEWREFLWRF